MARRCGRSLWGRHRCSREGETRKPVGDRRRVRKSEK